MSAFNYPENVNEPTYSTHKSQFSFSSEDICPLHMSSPSLSNHGSNKSAQSNGSSDDVVEATNEMKQGCFMIVLKLEVDDKGEMNENNNSLPIEWNHTSFSHCHKHISWKGSNKICIEDIDKVSKLHQASAERVQRALNIAGCEQIGLQAVTLRLTMKEEDCKDNEEESLINNEESVSYNYFLIFDEYRSAYIWNRGLRTILHMTNIGQPITTIAFCCSSVDRINNDEIYAKMKVNNGESEKWVNHIKTQLDNVSAHIFRANRFAQASCILDSSEHTTLLLQTKALLDLFIDARKLTSTPYYLLTRDDKMALREVWLSLLADLSVAMLKEHQLRNDMKASLSSVTASTQQNMMISK
eukprot:CAMPEP_0201566384 /NCGR_PEP_ID=MMETSP0190_2-20130828/6130_1 /ASSEMBLY_ACC=CAM_ASM_000263 /TAXON_ID=37353 /ORGANISM="Rosalina sp." /LENGTH=355 /DNA_ID=CAMNT_0047985019 /DNA_START=123 /DNA_END=1190 /DNA_ORIENTATION=-